jgi:hypothetical protein
MKAGNKKQEALYKLGFEDLDSGFMESEISIGNMIIRSYHYGDMFDLIWEKHSGEQETVICWFESGIVNMSCLVKALKEMRDTKFSYGDIIIKAKEETK